MRNMMFLLAAFLLVACVGKKEEQVQPEPTAASPISSLRMPPQRTMRTPPFRRMMPSASASPAVAP
jgi:hypothetical protein